MKVLAFDSTGPIISAAVSDRGVVVACRDIATERGHGNLLEAVIDGLLEDAGWRRADIEGIGLVTGPGSLTATRIGWATASGWAHAADIPVTGWTVPEVHRRKWKSQSGVSCIVHYRGATFLLYDLDGDSPLGPHVITVGQVNSRNRAPDILVGPGILGHRRQWEEYWGRDVRIVDDKDATVSAATLCVWAEQDLTKGIHLSLSESPLDYGLPPDFKKLNVP